MKKGVIKASLIGFFLLSIFGVIVFSLFSSAYSTEKTYTVGEGIHIALGEETNYTLRVVSPSEEFVTRGVGDSIYYIPKEVGVHEFYISYNGTSEKYSFNVIEKKEDILKSQDENITINHSDNLTEDYTQSELLDEGYRIAEQVEIDKPVKWENPSDITSKEKFTPAPQTKEEYKGELEKDVAVYSEENISYEDVLVHSGVEEVVKVGEKEQIKIYWEENESYINFEAKDNDNDSYIDEVQWIVPDLFNEQNFNIIIVTKAEHLSSYKTFISDIYEQVKSLDNIWSETINSDEYVRLTFEKNLTKENDITLFPKIISGNPTIEVYEKDKNELIAKFVNINSSESNQIFLTNLQGEQDTFDLKITGGSVQFDYIVDPTAIYDMNPSFRAYWGRPTSSNRWLAGTNATIGQYDNIKTENGAYAVNLMPTGTSNDYPFWRFNFTVNEEVSQINSLYIKFTGYDNATEVGTIYLYNVNSTWMRIGVTPAANGNVTMNITSGIGRYMNSTNHQVLLVVEGAAYDAGDALIVDYVGLTVQYNDITPPTFTTIPANASLFYGNESLLVQFTGADENAFDSYSINDSRFSINQTGFLSNVSPMEVGNYEINVTINDTSNNINWTRYKVQVNKSMERCQVLFNETFPLSYKRTFLVWANCTSSFILLRNDTFISNNSEQLLSAGVYNFSVLREDTSNYFFYYNETQIELNDSIFPIVDFDSTTPQNNSKFARNWLYVDAFVIEDNEKNITFSLYNSTRVVNSSTYTDGRRVINWTSLTEGVYYYNITVFDIYNNRNSTLTRKATLNFTLPSIIFSSGTENNFAAVKRNWIYANVSTFNLNQEINITFGLYNSSGLVNRSIFTDARREINWTSLPEGEYYYNVTLFDNPDGIVSTLTRSIILDKTSPNINVISPANNTPIEYSSQNLIADMTDNLGLSNFTIFIYNQTHLINQTDQEISGTSASTGVQYTFEYEGTFKWSYRAFDLAGNVFSTSNFTLFHDLTFPQIDYISPTEDADASVSRNWIYVNVSVIEDNEKNITFSLYNLSGLVNSSSYNTSRREINWTNLRGGDYYYNVTIFDIGLNENITSTRKINLNFAYYLLQITNPTVSNPLNVIAGENVSIYFNFTGDEVNVTSGVLLDSVLIGGFNSSVRNYINYSNIWGSDLIINASLPDIGSNSTPAVFYKDSSWYMITGNLVGNFNGYTYNGTNWLKNLTINTSLSDIGANSAPAVFYKDSSWYLISGSTTGVFYGFDLRANGSWIRNATIVTSLPDVGSSSSPAVFYKDSSWYMITGRLVGNFYGYVWSGSNWVVNTTINASLPDIGALSFPSVFQRNGTWYLLAGESSGNFKGFSWNGSSWLPNSMINASLPDLGVNTHPHVFYKDPDWYMISGENLGVFYGFNYSAGNLLPQFGYLNNVGWEVNVTVPSGLNGLKDLYINATYNLITKGDTEIRAFSYGDSVPPLSSFGASPIDVYNTTTHDITFDFKCSDDNAIDTIMLYGNWTGVWQANYTNSSAFNDAWLNITIYGIPNGYYKWGVWCNDTYNHQDWTDTNRTFKIDSTSPSLSIISPTNKSNLVDIGLDINYTVFDSLSGISSCWYSNDTYLVNSTLSNCVNITNVIWGIGNHNLTIWTNDTLNNINSSSITFDINFPVKVIINSPLGNTFNKNKTIIISTNISSQDSIDSAKAEITYPNLTKVNITLRDNMQLVGDNFDNNSMGMNWWKENSNNGPSQFCVADINETIPGKAFTSLSGDGAPKTDTFCSIISNKILDGDFDINISWNVLQEESNGDWAANFQLSEINSSVNATRIIYMDISDWEGQARGYEIFADDGIFSDYILKRSSSDTTGKFRINRTGNIFTFYTWNGTGWHNESVSRSNFVMSRQLYLTFESESAAPKWGYLNVSWDNFSVQSNNYKIGLFNDTTSDGTYNVRIYANSTFGITNNTATTLFRIDQINTAPSKPYVITPVGNTAINGLYNISWSDVIDSERDSLQFNITLLNPNLSFNSTIISNYGDSSTNYYTWNTNSNIDGIYSLNITVFETATAEKYSSTSILIGNFSISNTVPNVSVEFPHGETFDLRTFITLVINATDMNGIGSAIAQIDHALLGLPSENVTLYDLVLSDNFDYNTVGTLWEVENSSIGRNQNCFANIDRNISGKAFTSISGDGFPSTDTYCSLVSLSAVYKDFDINVSFNITSEEGQDYAMLFKLTEMSSSVNADKNIFLSIGNWAGYGRTYDVFINDGNVSSYFAGEETSDTYGKFRIKREGNNFTFYTWDKQGAGHWNEEYFAEDINLDRSLYITLESETALSGWGNISVVWDNLTVTKEHFLTAMYIDQEEDEGLHNVTFFVYDKLGNLNNTQKTNFTMHDINYPPTVPFILFPYPGAVIYGIQNITWSNVYDIDEDSLQFNITLLNSDLSFNSTLAANYGDSLTTFYERDTNNFLDGDYSLNVTVYENGTLDGYSTSYILDGNFSIDNTPPSINFISPTPENGSLVSGIVIVNVSAFDAHLDYITISNSTSDVASCQTSFCSYSWNTAGRQSGEYIFYVNAGDVSGIESMENITFYIDSTPPTFTIIPPNASLFYGNESLLVQFVGEDEVGFGYYKINDSRFLINQTGFLSNATSMIPGNYTINVTINDTSNNINWTLYRVQVKKSMDVCSVYFDTISPIFYPGYFIVYTDCTSDYTLYRNGTVISNASTIDEGAGYYNLTVQRTDRSNYTTLSDTEFFRVNKSLEKCQVLFNESSPLDYPGTFLVWANCTSPFTLMRNGTTISNNSEQILPVSAYNFSMLRTDNYNYTFYYNASQFRVRDAESPTFTTIPANASLFYGNESLLVQFVGEDDFAFGYYRVNDTRFSINQTGFLRNASPMAVGNYEINVSINDSYNNINWTRYKVQVNRSMDNCGIYFNVASPITYPSNFITYTNCTSAYNIYRNGTAISNASTINGGAGYYNLTVQRTDRSNYTTLSDTEFFTVNKNTENCQVLYNASSPITYPATFLTWANCTSPFTLRRNGTAISNNSVINSGAGAYNISFLRTDNQNYSIIFNQSQFIVNQSIDSCSIYFNATSPITYPSNFITYTNCTSAYNIYQNGTAISNASTINGGAGYYNLTVQRTDALNYTNSFDTEFFTVNKNPEKCQVLFNTTSILEYPATFLSWANCTTPFTLMRNGTTIVNNSEQALPLGTYNFSMLRTDSFNYTFYYNQTQMKITDLTNPNATLISPENNTLTSVLSQNMTLNATDNFGLSNMTLLVYNQTNLINQTTQSISGTQILTGIVYTFVSDGIFNWFYKIFDLAGNSFNTGNNTITIDSTGPKVNLYSPTNGRAVSNPLVWFSSNFNEVNYLANATFYLWNSTNNVINITTINITGSSNSTNISVNLPYQGNFKWNYFACDNLSNCAWNSTNYSLDYESPKVGLSVLYPPGNIEVAKNQFFNVTLNVSCLAGECGTINVSLDPLSWWDSSWLYRKQINVTNNNASAVLESGYSFNFTLDTTGNKFLDNGDDIRIVYYNGTQNIELDRINASVFNSSSTRIWFKLQKNISASGLDSNYSVYYGNPSAASPPTNKSRVYLFYDGFSDANAWSAAAGACNSSGAQGNPIPSLFMSGSGATDQCYTKNFNLPNSNFILEADVYISSTGGRGIRNIVFKQTATHTNGYMYRLQTSGGDGGFFIINGAGTWAKLGSNDPDYTADAWHNLRVLVRGSNFTAWVDNVYRNSVIDATYSNTKVGTQDDGGADTDSYVDNYIVRGYMSPDPSSSLGEEETSMKTGLVSTIVGMVPFYTNVSNPYTTSTLSRGQNQIITFYVNATGSGTHLFYAFANITSDLSISNITSSWNVTIDTIVPKLTIINPLNQSYEVSSLDFNISGDESLNSCKFTFNNWLNNYTMNKLNSTSFYYKNSSMIDNLYTAKFSCIDLAGNINNSIEVSFTVDVNGPIASLTNPLNATYSNNTLKNLSFSASDNVGLKNATLYVFNSSGSLINLTNLNISGKTIITGISYIFPYEGIFNWFYKIFDIGNHQYNTQNNTITIDTSNPLINYGSQTQNDYANVSQNWIYFNITINETNFANLTFYLYNGSTKYFLFNQTTYSDSRRAINWTNLGEGLYWYNATVMDLALNRNITETRQIRLDTSAPTIRIFFPDNFTYGYNITFLNYTVSDPLIDRCWYSINDVSNISIACNQNISTSIGDGIYTWKMYSNDTLGHLGLASVSFKVDTGVPAVIIDSPQNITYSYNVSTINFTARDSTLDKCWYILNGGPNISTSCSANITNLFSQEGLNEWWIYANDSDNNVGADFVFFTVDTISPNLTIINPHNESYYPENIFFNVSGSENLDFCQFTINNWVTNYTMIRYNFTDFNYVLNSIATGNYNVQFWCNDSIGNVNIPTNISFSALYPNINLDLIYPKQPINVAKSSYFNFTVNVSCDLVDCGVINLTLDPSENWWNKSWNYRKPVNLSSIGSVLTDFQINLSFNLTNEYNLGKVKSDCSDIRFTNGSAVEISYWTESCNITGGNSSFLVKVPSIASAGNTLIYMYYGNSNALNKSNASTTFDFYDTGNVVGNWTLAGTSGQTAAQGLPQPSYYAASSSGSYMYKNISLTPNKILEYNARSDGLGNLFFLTNSAGAGQHMRLETRGGNNVGIGPAATWTSWSVPSQTCANLATNTWFNFKLVIGATTAQAYVDNVACGGAYTFTNNGGYVGLVGDGLGPTYTTWWDNFRVRKYSVTLPTVSLGNEEIKAKGVVSTIVGDIPFFTNENPKTTSSLKKGESQVISFVVNATGNPATYEFFAIANLIKNVSVTNSSSSVNVTIISSFVTLIYPENSYNFSNFTIPFFNFSISEGTFSNCKLYGNWSNWSVKQTINNPESNVTLNFLSENVGNDGYYAWNVNCTDISGGSITSITNYTFSSFLPVDPLNSSTFIVYETLSDGKGNVILSWNNTNHTAKYKIYYTENASIPFVLLGVTSNLNYTDTNANQSRRRYYKISSWNPISEEINGDVIAKTIYYLKRKPSVNTINWIGLYTQNNLTTANRSLNRISNITAFTMFNSTTQKKLTCNNFSCPSFPSCTDTNCDFNIIDGQGYEVSLNSSSPIFTNWSTVGLVKEKYNISLPKNLTSFGKNWVSMYYNSSLSNAYTLMASVSHTDAVTHWNEFNQTTQGLILNPMPFGPPYVGTNFVTEPEKGYEISVNQSSNYNQS